ncbi:MAG: hypothetical protein DME99_13030 [Verrucomicrobia bacterium]|nr:MAG: hypothetical protein DME99_13030 [Verrucomicrobiota bacterium]
MKPILMTTCEPSRRDSFDHTMCQHRSQITNYSYHSIALGGSSANYARGSARSFWNITGDYFKNEARRDFLGEVALWAVLVLTAFLPLISNAHAVMEFVRAISNY